MYITERDLSSRACSVCFKFLSVKPIKSYSNGQIKCGRCSRKNSDGVNVDLPPEFDRIKFPCNNRYEGCTAQLTYKETENHERTCQSFIYDCPRCDCSGPSYLILKHFQLEHPEYILHYGSTIPVNLKANSDDGSYLYVDNSINLLAFAKYTFDSIQKDLQIFTFDAQVFGINKRGTQRVELYTISNKLQWSSETKTCEPLMSDNNKIIEANLDIHDYPNYVLLCRVFISDDGGVEILDKLENSNSTFSQEQSPNIPNNFSPPLDLLTTPSCSDSVDVHIPTTPIPAEKSLDWLAIPCYSDSIDVQIPTTPIPAGKSLGWLATPPCSDSIDVAIPTTPIPAGKLVQQSSNVHKCALCEMVCRSGAGLANHMRAHDRADQSQTAIVVRPVERDGSKYKCPQCDKVCQSGAGLASHIRSHNRTSGSADLRVPVKKSPTKENLYKCKECEMTFKTSESFLAHRKVHERKQNASSGLTVSSGSESYPCPECGRVCASGAGLASHRRSHERERNSSSGYSDALSILHRIHSNTKSENNSNGGISRCLECGRDCASGAGLASHMRAHERQRNESFGVALRSSIISSGYFNGGGSFSSGGGGGGGYSCSQCGRVCASGAGLASHMRAHARGA